MPRAHHALQDRTTWITKANGGDRVAGLCISAISRWLNVMLTEHSACACCDTVFPDSEFPRAFLVLIPAKEDPDTLRQWLTGCVGTAARTTTNGLSIRAGSRRAFGRAEASQGSNPLNRCASRAASRCLPTNIAERRHYANHGTAGASALFGERIRMSVATSSGVSEK